MLAVGEDAAEGFYRLVDACYEKRSLAVSSNLHPAGFDEIMPKTLATATVDRLLHHAHICVVRVTLRPGGRCWIRTNLAGFWLGAILRKPPLTRQINAQRYSLLLPSFQRVTACRRPGS